MRAISLITLVAGTSIALAACGGSSNSNSATNAASQAVAGKQASFIAFSECMRAHGVPNFPDISGGLSVQQTNGGTSVNGVAVNSPAFRSGLQTCHSKLPNGGKSGPPSAGQRKRALQFSQCMRSHGVSSFPDPTFSGNGAELRLTPGSGIDPNSPAFKSAQAACGSIIGKAP